jgi:hypothetical protein
LLRRGALGTVAARTATPSAPPPAALAFRPRRLLLLLLLLLGRVAWWALLWTRCVLRALAAGAIALSPTPRLLRPRVGTRRTSTARAPLVAALPSRLLLELLHFALHETARLRLLAVGERVMPAIRATLPAFGVRLLARGTKNAFR